MQGIYNYIPKTNHVSRVCSVAAILYLQFMVHVMIFPLLLLLFLLTLSHFSASICWETFAYPRLLVG